MIAQGNWKKNILDTIKTYGPMGCAGIASEISLALKKDVNPEAVGRVLYQMVQDGLLAYHPTQRGPKGGHVYILGEKKLAKRKFTFHFNVKPNES